MSKEEVASLDDGDHQPVPNVEALMTLKAELAAARAELDTLRGEEADAFLQPHEERFTPDGLAALKKLWFCDPEIVKAITAQAAK